MDSYLPVLPPIAALVLFALWAIALVISIGIWRSVLVFSGKAEANGFPSGTQHGGDLYWRLNRAHINTVENLPIFGAIVLSGFYLQVQDSWFQILPGIVLYARIVQSVIHIASGSPLAVTLRFLAYGVQLIAMIVMAIIVGKAAGVPFPF